MLVLLQCMNHLSMTEFCSDHIKHSLDGCFCINWQPSGHLKSERFQVNYMCFGPAIVLELVI